ncbi:flavodoxin domain-containing protein [Pseudoalteromonas sp. T1lg65]|uniref:flavodoxin domain-containing protein n=1 Tax=Pseudoalteromonas sp. T1lg65 TaxID=2077101 RepID=UPI003F79A901
MQAIDIIVGSQMGSAEYVAEQLLESLENQGINAVLHEQPDLSQCTNSYWLLVTSTYGAGDYPDNLLPFIEALNGTETMADRCFSVVGIGDSNYDTFNHAANNLATLLKEKGAKQLLEVKKIDVQDPELPEDTALAWLPQFVESLPQ